MRTLYNIKLLTLFTACTNAVFMVPVIVPYYRDRMGLTFHDFLIGEAAFAVVVVLLEVPTGWISDIWRRKNVLALGACVHILGYMCLMAGDSLVWAVAAQSIFGVSVSLISGTNTALLYDTLLSANRAGEFRAREGARAGAGFYSTAMASIASGFLYVMHPLGPIYASFIAYGIAAIAALMMEEPARHKKIPDRHPLADMGETMRYALRGHADVGVIILFAAVMFSATKMIMWAQQPYYMAMKLNESLFGILMAMGFAVAGMSSHLGHKLDGKISSTRALMLAWLVAILVCLGASLHLGWSGVALLMLGGTGLYGMTSPRVSEAINARVSSERRATILSTQNLMVSLLFIPLSMGLGQLSEHFGIRGALGGLAAWLGLAGLFLIGIGRRQKKKAG